MTGVPTRILVAVTPPAESDEAVAVAVALAAALGAELVLAGIAPFAPPAIVSDELPDVTTLDEQAETQRLLDRAVEEQLKAIASRLPADLDARTLLTWGSVGPAVVEAAQDQRADLVVLPMRRESELQHLVHDHADRHVLHHSDVPVLVVPTDRRPSQAEPPRGWAA